MQDRYAGDVGDFGKFAVLRALEAVRLRPYSSRFYLLADGDEGLSRSLRAFAKRWGDDAEHFARRTRGS